MEMENFQMVKSKRVLFVLLLLYSFCKQVF